MIVSSVEQFSQAARNVGAEVLLVKDLESAVAYIADRVDGEVMVATCPSLARLNMVQALSATKVNVLTDGFREKGAAAVAGVTGANFAIAATGTVVLESTDEAVRIATTLPEKHFVIVDPRKILDNAEQAVPILNIFHEKLPQAYMAYITGPSRTADIERVLTIGVHGPAELHILLLEGLSEDVMER